MKHGAGVAEDAAESRPALLLGRPFADQLADRLGRLLLEQAAEAARVDAGGELAQVVAQAGLLGAAMAVVAAHGGMRGRPRRWPR